MVLYNSIKNINMTYHRDWYCLVEVLIESKISGDLTPPSEVKHDTANDNTNDGDANSADASGLESMEHSAPATAMRIR